MAIGIFSKLANSGGGGGGGPVEGVDVLSTAVGAGLVLTAQGDGTSAWDSVAGTGDVVGPSGADDNGLVLFDNTTGKLIKQSAGTGVVKVASGVASASAVVNADVDNAAAIAFSKLAALPSAQILVGSAGNVPTAVAVTGDVTISNAGVTAIGTGVIVNADISASAAIDYSKLAALSSGNILVGSAGNVATSVAMSSEATISNAGAVTLANSAVIAKVLTGFSAGAGTVAATDTILQAIQKLVGNIGLLYTAEIDHSDMGATETFDFSQGPAHYGNISADCAVTLSNGQSGAAYSLLIEANGTNEITWSTTVDWLGAGAPDFSAMADGELGLVNLYYSGTKSTYVGSYKLT